MKQHLEKLIEDNDRLTNKINNQPSLNEETADEMKARFRRELAEKMKFLKAKNLSELGKSSKWQWSFNEHGELTNGNLGGRYLNVNENNGKIKLSPGGLSRIWSFGSVAVDENVENPVID